MDDNLFSRFESRDESVLSEIDLRYGRLIAFVARNITNSDEDAEEIRNDVLRKLWDSIPPARPDSIRSYSAMIARRLALNRVESAAAINDFLASCGYEERVMFSRRYVYAEEPEKIARLFGSRRL